LTKLMPKKKIIVLISIIVIILLGAGVFYWFKIKSNPAEKLPVATEKNYYEINDELAGVSFKIGKKFDRMPAQQLQMKNPSFVYGFLSQDDVKVNCFISQTQRENAGVVKVAELRDGVLEQLKKTNPDVRLEEAKVIDIGENNNKGAKLKMSYTEAEKTPMIQWEVTGITEKKATFAFCVSPRAVLDLYQEDLELFLDSVRIK